MSLGYAFLRWTHICDYGKQLVKSKLSPLQRGKVNCHYRVKPMR